MQEPHRNMSCTRSAVLHFSPAASANDSTSENIILILFGHYSSLRSFAGMTEQLTQDQTVWSMSGQRWCVESNVLLLIYALLALLVTDTVNFLQECSVQLELMVSDYQLSTLILDFTAEHRCFKCFCQFEIQPEGLNSLGI